MLVIILVSATFVLQVIFNVLVGSLYEDLGEDLGSWAHINSTLTRKIIMVHANIFHAHQ
jgi:hypothetical protein